MKDEEFFGTLDKLPEPESEPNIWPHPKLDLSFCFEGVKIPGERLSAYQHDEMDRAIYQKFPFFKYAATHWARHYRTGRPNTQAAHLKSVQQLCSVDSQRYRNWLRAHARFLFLKSHDPGFPHQLMVASYLGLKNVVRSALKLTVDIETRDTEQDNYRGISLAWAASFDHEAVIKLLLEAGANIEAPDCFNRTPLYVASQEGREAATKVLLASGANPDTQARSGGAIPLILSATKGHVMVVHHLLEAGARVNLKETDESLPWHGSLNTKTKKVLLERYNRQPSLYTEREEIGRDKDFLPAQGKIKRSWHQTALMKAAEEGHSATVEALLQAGADMVAKDKDGATALELAQENKPVGIVKLLKKWEQSEDILHSSTGNHTLMMDMIIDNNTFRVDYLLSKGPVRLNARNTHNETPLMLAAKFGCTEIATLLLDRNPYLNARNKLGETALFVAVKGNCLEIVELLISAGADVHLANNNGQSPLERARKFRYGKAAEALEEKLD